jgi:general secretion pathway protein K
LAAAVAISLASAQSQWAAQVTQRRDQVQAQSIALAGVQWTRQILDAARAAPFNHLGEPWAMPLPATPVENGSVEGRIVDAQGMLNVNNLASGSQSAPERQRFTRLFEALRVAPSTLATMIDWVDSDNVEEPGGAEDSWYQRMAQPGLAPNMPATRIEELGDARMSATVLGGLIRYVTALPDDAPLNVNTAPAELLAASIDGMDAAARRVRREPCAAAIRVGRRVPATAARRGVADRHRLDVHDEKPLLPRVRDRPAGRHDREGARSSIAKAAPRRASIGNDRMTAQRAAAVIVNCADASRLSPRPSPIDPMRGCATPATVGGRARSRRARAMAVGCHGGNRAGRSARTPRRAAVPPMPQNRLRDAARFALEDQMAASADEAAIAIATSGRPVVAAIARACWSTTSRASCRVRSESFPVGARASQRRMDVVHPATAATSCAATTAAPSRSALGTAPSFAGIAGGVGAGPAHGVGARNRARGV